ncbi:MAG TPA: hypothetical protein VFO05_01155 [Candidatus Limnocylindrales bacterium]|nr:hypothetical protein [Candidatus Limnocylindrales bacterium]
MLPGLRHLVRLFAALAAVLIGAVAVAGCAGATFDPSGPCTADGRAAGAYPSLESLLPRDLGGKAPASVDSGRNCTERALGSLVAHGVRELRFAGSTWETGTSSGVTIAVLEAPDLRADWVHEFYRLGAESARKTESVDSSAVDVVGTPGFRVDTLNGESYQTVIDWQEGDVVRVVLVSSFIREVDTKEGHEATVRAALEAATAQSP